MISPWLAAITALACARATRLITRDHITAPARMWLVNRWGIDSKRAYLIQCDWCTGLWVAALFVPVAWLFGDRAWLYVPLTILAAAHIVGYLAGREAE